MYDVAIVGSGLGGLICADILSKEGMKVCMIEQHSVAGGSLQTFKRDGRIFDTGVHYVGGLEEGQNLHTYFKYLGIMDDLNIRRLDDDGFDRICFKGHKHFYPLAAGYDNFIEQLAQYFPHEREGLENYVSYIRKTVSSFPLYNISVKSASIPEDFFYQKNAKAVIESFIRDPLLSNVLAGNNGLYAGVASKTPIHVHALINDNFMKSSWRFVDGGSQISDLLVRNLKNNGVDILTGHKVTKFVAERRTLKHIEVNGKEKIFAEKFISTMHPADMLDILEGDTLNPAYREKIYSLEDTIGVFGLYMNLKKETFPYINSNYYCHESENVWRTECGRSGNSFNSFMFLTPAISASTEYADSAIALGYMKYEEVKKWENTKYLRRGKDYEDFKTEVAEIFIDQITEKFPDLKGSIENFYTSTPLTFRDYVGARNGALYGVLRNCDEPQNSFISPKTRIKNLYLSGQNIILHGVLGVTIGSILTAGSMLGYEYLVDKIREVR